MSRRLPSLSARTEHWGGRLEAKVALESRGSFVTLLLMPLGAFLSCPCAELRGATVSSLYARGYTVLPAPQKVQPGEHDFRFGQDWRLQLGPGVSRSDIAVESLNGSESGVLWGNAVNPAPGDGGQRAQTAVFRAPGS